MSLPSIPSFNTLDQTHYIATGEHLQPIAGNLAPHPVEYYIKQTMERQQRSRLWEILDDTIRGSDRVSVKPGIIVGIAFTHAQRYRDEIRLFKDGIQVISLTPDGIEPLIPTPISSPPPPFVIKSPYLNNPAFELTNDTLLSEHSSAKVDLTHAKEHLTAIQTAMRMRHISKI